MRRLPRAVPRDERGNTLIEISVVLMVLSLVLGASLSAFVVMQRAATGGEYRLQNLDEARVIMATMTKDIRTATILEAGSSPFILADATQVVFYGNLNTTSGGPNHIRIYVDTTTPGKPVLVEQITPADAGSAPSYTYCAPAAPPCAATLTRFVGKYVSNSMADPLFEYYDDSGNAIPTPVSDPDKLMVRAVGINLKIRVSVYQYLPATTLVNRVRLPNVFYSVQATPPP